MTRVLNYLWTLWCSLWIIIVVLLLLPIFAVAVQSGIRSWKIWAHHLVKVGARVVLFLWGVRVVVHGNENMPTEGQYVFVGNHRSDLDAIITLGFLKGYWKYLGKAELLKWPVIGYLVGQIYVTVDRSDRRSREESVRQMEQQVRDGASITIFPEGWSNFSKDYLLEFKEGAFHLAVNSRLPIGVFTIIGSHELFPKPRWTVRPGSVHVFWEGVLETAGETDNALISVESLKQQVREIWLSRLKAHYPNGYTYPENWPDFDQWKQGMMNRKKS